MTRGMRNKLDNPVKTELLDGLEDDQQVQRISCTIRKRRCVPLEDQEEITVELDGLPGVESKYLKRVSYSSKDKIYDKINVREEMGGVY
jgi:hypothetical protein